jgi:hypothetical protein
MFCSLLRCKSTASIMTGDSRAMPDCLYVKEQPNSEYRTPTVNHCQKIIAFLIYARTERFTTTSRRPSFCNSTPAPLYINRKTPYSGSSLRVSRGVVASFLCVKVQSGQDLPHTNIHNQGLTYSWRGLHQSKWHT